MGKPLVTSRSTISAGILGKPIIVVSKNSLDSLGNPSVNFSSLGHSGLPVTNHHLVFFVILATSWFDV